MADLTPEQRDREMRRLRFRPCETKEELSLWFQSYLRLDFPDGHIDPMSTSSPMELIWEIYSLARRGGDPEISRFLAYANRSGYKTLAAAAIEVVMVLHCLRPPVHLAAILEQSQKAQEYVRKFFDSPYFADFKMGDNKRDISFVRYQRGDDWADNLTDKQYKRLTSLEKVLYRHIALKLELAVCTLQGTNSKHTTYMSVDEIDVVTNPRAYKEARFIPKKRGDQYPITLLTSTRKTAVGKVQTEIDNAIKTKLQIRNWNIIDITEACPSSRHCPDLPKLPIYYCEDTLEALSEDQWNDRPPNEKEKFRVSEGFAGCLSNCRLFAACQGRLATEQKGTAKLLNSVDDTQQQFRDADIDDATAQLLCRKPSSHGLIYPRLDRKMHVKTHDQVWEMVTGEKPKRPVTHQALVQMFHQRGCKFWGGMDFGFTHAFTLSIGVEDGHREYILEALEFTDLESEQQIEQSQFVQELYHNPGIYPDMGSPGLIKSFRKAGFRMLSWKKGPDTVLDGIKCVKTKLRPAMGEPELFFVESDRINQLVLRLSRYHWKVDALGRITDEPDKNDPDAPDDACDGTRYLIQNRFPVRSQKKRDDAEVRETKRQKGEAPPPTPQQQVWAQQIAQEVGVDLTPGPRTDEKGIRRGRFFFAG